MRDEDDKIQLVSHFPGRFRVRAGKFREEPDAREAVVKRLRGEPGVVSVHASALTGSILVTYDPRTVQIEALLAVLLSASNLSGIAADAQASPHGTTALAGRVKQTFASMDVNLFRAASGKLDLRTAVPGALLLSGVTTLLVKSLVMPQWYDLVFWSYVTFNNLHLGNRGPSSDAR